MNISIYDKNKDSDSKLQEYLVKGKYVFYFTVPVIDCSGLRREKPYVFGALGKTAIIEKVIVPDENRSKVAVYVDLVENPIPIAVLLGGVAAIGIIGIVFLDKIEKVVNVMKPIAALAVGGLYLWTNK